MRSVLAPGSVRLQPTGRYALTARDHSVFALRPDIVVDNDIVIYTKWKSLNPDDRVVGVEPSDVYQMLAYAHPYDARRVILLYRAITFCGTGDPGLIPDCGLLQIVG